MNAYAAKRPLHPAIIFIYGYRDLAMPRVSRAEGLSPLSRDIPNDNGILVPYLAASELFLGRQGGGASFSSTQIKHSAAAYLSPISSLCMVIKKQKTLDDGRHEHIGERQQDAVPYVEVREQHRSIVRFIIGCSNVNCA